VDKGGLLDENGEVLEGISHSHLMDVDNESPNKKRKGSVDGFRVARTRGTTRRTQKIRTQGAECVRSWIATKHGDGSLECRTRYALQRETPSLPRFRALVVR
jgi:hypothetical protein